jgi:hypothetical protein
MGEMTEFANPATYVVEGILVFFILWKILSARRGRDLFIRRIPGLSVLDEAVGRATEMGKPMLYVPGLGGLDIVGLQSMSIMSHVIKHAAAYSTRVIVPLCDPVLFTVAEEVARDAYATAGVPEQYISEDIRYLGVGRCWNPAPRANRNGVLLRLVRRRGPDPGGERPDRRGNSGGGNAIDHANPILPGRVRLHHHRR